MWVLSENNTAKKSFLLTCFIVFVSQFHTPLLTFLHHTHTYRHTLLHTHGHTHRLLSNWHFVTHVYVMHLVELLCPKSLILDLFVVQNKNVYWFLVWEVGGKYQKYLWIVSQCLKIACKTIMSSNAYMTFVLVHHSYCSEPKVYFFLGNLTLLFVEGGGLRKKWWLFFLWRKCHNMFMKFD